MESLSNYKPHKSADHKLCIPPYKSNCRMCPHDKRLKTKSTSLKLCKNYNNNHLTAVCPGQPGRLVPEETFTRSHPSWSMYFLYHLSPFATVHGILFIQLTCLTVLSNNLFPGLPLGLEPSTSCSIHFFTQSSSSFCSTCPDQRSLFCCNINAMSLSQLLTWESVF